MIVLALDTCLGACSAAILADGRLAGSFSEPMTRGHQERLAPAVRELMARAMLGFADLDRIGVTIGPGSFTGLRVGLAFAKGLALALDRPCVGVGVLEALAASSQAVRCAAVIDAGRGQLYFQPFANGEPLATPANLTLAEATGWLRRTWADDVTLVGPGAALLAREAPNARFPPLATPLPEAIARLAARAPLAPPRPLYLRAPDAKAKAR